MQDDNLSVESLCNGQQPPSHAASSTMATSRSVSISCAPFDEPDGETNNQFFVVNVHGCSAKKFLAQILETLHRHQHIIKDAAVAMEKEHGDLEVRVHPSLPVLPGQRSGTFLTPLLDYAKYQSEVLVEDKALATIQPKSLGTPSREKPQFRSIDTELFQIPHPSVKEKYRSSWRMWDDGWNLTHELMSFIMLPKSGPYTPLANKVLFERLAWYAREMYGAVTRQTLYRSAWNILLGHIKGLLIDIALFAKLRIVYNMHLPRLHLREWGTRNIRAFIENLQLDLNRYLMLSDYNLDGYHGERVLVKRARCPPDCYKEDSPNRIEASVPLSSLNIIIPDSTYLESLLRRVIKPLHLAVDNLKTKLAGLALKIHSFVCKQGLSHTSQLLKTNSQVSRSTVYRVINQLLSTNMIRRVEHGLYAPFTEEEEENDEHKQPGRQKVLSGHHEPGERTHYADTNSDLATVYSELDVLLLEITVLQPN